jgi:exo-poly-alpha-galacturonosidase
MQITPSLLLMILAAGSVLGPKASAMPSWPLPAPADTIPESLVRAAYATASTKSRFLVTDYGAVGDGRRDNTRSIQGAIDACATKGGGIVVVPEGVFISGSLFFRPRTSLRVEKGAVLKATSDPAGFPARRMRVTGFVIPWRAAFINAEQVDDFELSGEGTIDGSGLGWWEAYWAEAKRAPDDHTVAPAGGEERPTGTPRPAAPPDPQLRVPRPTLVNIQDSHRILVRDVLLKDAGYWNLLIYRCDGAIVRQIRVRAPHEPVHAASSDGIDIDCSRNVLIEGCDIINGDDAICMKAGRTINGVRETTPTERVLIRNCRVGYSLGMVTMGSETGGGIRDIRVENMEAYGGCRRVIRFKTNPDRGGIVEDIVFDGIRAADVGNVFDFDHNAYSTMWMPPELEPKNTRATGRSIVRNIVVRNVQAERAQSAGLITGTAEIPIENLSIENVSIAAKSGIKIEHTVNLKCLNFTVNGAGNE